MSDLRAVSFPNLNGQKLFGTLHLPDAGAPQKPCVVLLSPGVKMRVGPGRLYVPLTEALTGLGHPVLRFDFFGLGDSEGELSETMLADIYNHIEVGRYVDDTLAALALAAVCRAIGSSCWAVCAAARSPRCSRRDAMRRWSA